MEKYDTINYRGYVIDICYDEYPEDPRNFCEHDSVIYSNHKNSSPDGHDFDEILGEDGTISKDFKRNNVYLNVYGYSHSGLALSTERNYPFNDPWDSGLFGIIAISKDKIKEITGHKIVTAKDKQEWLKYLNDEIEELNHYLQGEVYGYMVHDERDDWGASAWQYIGDVKYCIEDAKAEIDAHINALERESCDFWSGKNVA